MSVLLFSGIGFWDYEPGMLGKISLFFLKAGAFVFGSGLAIVPFLHGGVVVENHWLTETQFIDAVAVAMITPGPVVITVGFIGYLIGWFSRRNGSQSGHLSSLLFIHCDTRALFQKNCKKKSGKSICGWNYCGGHGCTDGIGICYCDANGIKDVPTFLIALSTLLALIYIKKLKEPVIILFWLLIYWSIILRLW